jgi:hypothetical protein
MTRLSTLSFLVCVAIAAPASAQEQAATDFTRRAALAAERDRKAADTAPPERSTVERALYWYDNQALFAKITGSWHGFHLAGGDFPAGAGTKAGVGFDRALGSSQDLQRANRIEVSALTAYSTRGYSRTSAAVAVRRLAGAPLDLRVHGQRYEFPQEDFFGLGAGSQAENRTNYLQEGTETGADLRWTPSPLLELGAGAALVSPSIGTGTDTRYLSVEQRFDPATLPGYSEQPDFLRTDASVAFDWRDNPLHPHAGGRYSVEFSRYADRDLDAFDFNRVDVELQQYVPLPNRYRTLALRAAAAFTDPGAGQDVPFFYQPTLGGGQQLRGFREFRFRDRNSLVLTA